MLARDRQEDPWQFGGMQLRKYLSTFRHFDTAGTGVLSGEALRTALARHHGGQLSAKDFAQLLAAGADAAESSSSPAVGDESATTAKIEVPDGEGHPHHGLGVIGSDIVDLGFASFSLILTLHSVSKEHSEMPE